MDAIERVRNLEVQLATSRKAAASVLRDTRNKLGLSMRQVSRGVRLSPAAIHNIERNKSWKTRTAQRIARFYSNAA